MKFHLAVILVIWFIKTVNLEGLSYVAEKDIENESGSESISETNKTGAVSVVNEGLSSDTLSDLYDLAKNISHSKGIYMETDKEIKLDDEREIRRSILRKIAVSTESDAIKKLLLSFNSDNEDNLQLLKQMEYLVHQYDVAITFATLGGIESITPLLFSPNEKIVSSVASVLGAAMQSNPIVQKLAFKYNVGGSLFKQLSHESPTVLSKIVFALGSFLRNLPDAQEEFLRINGISKLSLILKNHQISTNTKLKIINIFNDLEVEHQTAKLYPSDRSLEDIQKLEKLFVNEIQDSDICELIPTFLDLEDLDTHQKIVTAMTSLCSICIKDFNNEGINSRIKKLIKLYDPETDGEGPVYPHIDKDLKRTIYIELKSLLKEINQKTINKPNDDFESRKTEL